MPNYIPGEEMILSLVMTERRKGERKWWDGRKRVQKREMGKKSNRESETVLKQ